MKFRITELHHFHKLKITKWEPHLKHLDMYEIFQSATFSQWLGGLKDEHARLDRVRLGNFGDAELIGEGLSELRIHFGPGYRLYCIQRENRVVMLCGGDKPLQPRDIEKAKIIA